MCGRRECRGGRRGGCVARVVHLHRVAAVRRRGVAAQTVARSIDRRTGAHRYSAVRAQVVLDEGDGADRGAGASGHIGGDDERLPGDGSRGQAGESDGRRELRKRRRRERATTQGDREPRDKRPADRWCAHHSLPWAARQVAAFVCVLAGFCSTAWGRLERWYARRTGQAIPTILQISSPPSRAGYQLRLAGWKVGIKARTAPAARARASASE